MIRRPLMLACAAALSAAAVAAAPAVADDGTTCTTTDEGSFYGTTVCVERNAATTGTNYVPFSVGSVCVGYTCTPAQSGYIAVPQVNGNVVRAYGQLCYTVKIHTCKPFDSSVVWTIIGSGNL